MSATESLGDGGGSSSSTAPAPGAHSRHGDYGQHWGEGAARCFSIEGDFLNEDEAVHLMPVPDSFICPISAGIMVDPVATVDGCTYERGSIERWFREKRQGGQTITSPITGLGLPSATLMPLVALQRAIEVYLKNRPELKLAHMAGRSFEEAAQILQTDLFEKQAMHASATEEVKRLRQANRTLRRLLEEAEKTLRSGGLTAEQAADAASAAAAAAADPRPRDESAANDDASTADAQATSGSGGAAGQQRRRSSPPKAVATAATAAAAAAATAAATAAAATTVEAPGSVPLMGKAKRRSGQDTLAAYYRRCILFMSLVIAALSCALIHIHRLSAVGCSATDEVFSIPAMTTGSKLSAWFASLLNWRWLSTSSWIGDPAQSAGSSQSGFKHSGSAAEFVANEHAAWRTAEAAAAAAAAASVGSMGVPRKAVDGHAAAAAAGFHASGLALGGTAGLGFGGEWLGGFPRGEGLATATRPAPSADALPFLTQVEQLWTGSADERQRAALRLRNLAADNTENQVAIVQAGAIAPLVKLLQDSDEVMREEAARALWNLARSSKNINSHNQNAIAQAGAIPPLIRLLEDAVPRVRVVAAAVLNDLAIDNEANQVAITKAGVIEPLINLVKKDDAPSLVMASSLLQSLAKNHSKDAEVALALLTAIAPLVGLLKTGSLLAQEEAALTLGVIALSGPDMQTAIVRAGAVGFLVQRLKGDMMQGTSAMALRNLAARNAETQAAIAEAGAIPPLVRLVEAGLPGVREEAAHTLMSLAEDNLDNQLLIMGAEGVVPLADVLKGVPPALQPQSQHGGAAHDA
eukprot:TRINITY_DN7180_c0_g2_i1.p1 TRINITY_DN7180_c0_g2~~TRINITY_DN7180_c0_g2_i1.p1  ORF type:complete len:809 (-),score=234.95 TRINITY_DN7180_c0_g2_i1:235-2661(-)